MPSNTVLTLFADEISLRLLDARTFPSGVMVNTHTQA
jgi:hypothetical protein